MSKVAIARLKNVRISVRKLCRVVGMINGRKVSDAMRDLEFSNKSVSSEVLCCLKSAIANAENNYGLDIDNLFISRAIVGKSMVMKRFRARAKGRAGRINKFFSNLSIFLKELEVN